ncbi:Small ribosomal subunit biogenesis GTPase RsgA OS=Streptomyces gougerotii OX=53448 GN=rsgA PE=3 SV=1 [Streptomyces diastaticus subsp. diastaticus]
MPLPASSKVPDRSTALASPLVPYGWDDGWQDAFRPWAARGLVPGRVIRVDRGQCDVVTPDGTVRADTAFVVPRDPMKVICTGDWAALDPEGGSPRYVRDHLPRRTALVRSGSSKRSDAQVLAANIDRAVIAVSLAAELDLARIERFTALAWESGAEPLVVLTKADLVPDPATLGHLLSDVGRTVPGVTVLAVSSADGTGLERLAALAGPAPPCCSASPGRASPPSPTP